jgi:hypothetical protein
VQTSAMNRLVLRLSVCAAIVTCGLPLMLTVGAMRASAQASSKRRVDVTVTDPRGRFVTGLEQQSFEVVENGVRRALTDFSDVASPLSIAIVTDGPLPDVGPLGPEDELIQTPSLSNALRQLAASKNQRKVIVNLSAADASSVPSGIQVLQTDRANLVKAVVELHNQYRLEFESSSPSARFEVVLKPPAGLPHLELTWK